MKNITTASVMMLIISLGVCTEQSDAENIGQRINLLKSEATSKEDLISSLAAVLSQNLSKGERARVLDELAQAHARSKLNDEEPNFSKAKEYCNQALVEEENVADRISLLKTLMHYELGEAITNGKEEVELRKIKGLGLLRLIEGIEKDLTIKIEQELPQHLVTLEQGVSPEKLNSEKLSEAAIIKTQNFLFREHRKAIDKFIKLFDESKADKMLGKSLLQQRTLRPTSVAHILQELAT